MKKLLPLLFVILLVFATWWRLSELSLRGDSFVYFIDRVHETYLTPFIPRLANFDWSAVVFGKVLSDMFGANLSLYGWTEVIFMIATVVTFFLVLLKITKKTLMAFTGSLILGMSYYGNWDMYAGGIYPWFLERIPLMLLLIPSFAFLHLYLEKSKVKYYIYSVALFFLGVGIAHWGLFFTAPYVLYPILWQVFTKGKKKIFRYFLLGLTYFAISCFYVFLQEKYMGGAGPSWTFFEFTLNPSKYKYFQDITSQLVYWTTYLPFIDLVKRGFPVSPIAIFVKAETSLRFSFYIVATYLFAFLFTFIRLPKFRPLLTTVVLSILSIFYLNSYFGQYHIASQPGSSRYLYLPTYLFAIFWTLFLTAAFWFKKSRLYVLGFLVLLGYVIINYWLISENFKWVSDNHLKTKKIWNLALEVGSQADQGDFIVIPGYETGAYEAEFLTDEFKERQVRFVTDDLGWENQVKDAKNIYKLTYDKNCGCALSSQIDKKSLKND